MKRIEQVSKVTLLLLALVISALAGGPTIVDNPFTSFVIPAANHCGTFDVNAAPAAGRPNGGRLILFANSAIGSGPVFVTLTNLSTGKSINLNISGPGKFSFTNSTSVVAGPTLFIGFPPVAPSNLQGIAFATGRTVIQFDDSGNIISVSYVGSAPQNVCALLE
jgi:hypothetical protein